MRTTGPLQAALLMSVEEDVAAYSARAYECMRNAALEGCLADSVDRQSYDVTESMLLQEALQNRSRSEDSSSDRDAEEDARNDAPIEIPYEAQQTEVLGGIVQKHIEESPPSEVPHEAVSAPDALSDDFEYRRQGAGGPQTAPSAVLAAAGRRSLTGRTEGTEGFPSRPQSAPRGASPGERRGDTQRDERRDQFLDRFARSPHVSGDVSVGVTAEGGKARAAAEADTPEQPLHNEEYADDEALDCEALPGLTDMGGGPGRTGSPLSRSLQAFTDTTDISPVKAAEEAPDSEVEEDSHRRDDSAADVDGSWKNEVSEVSATNMSTLVAADIDRLLGLTSSPGEAPEPDKRREETVFPEDLSDDGELDRWMSRDMGRSIDQQLDSKLSRNPKKAVPGGTMRRLEKWMDSDQLEVSLDTNSSDEDVLENRARGSAVSYDSKLVPSEADLIGSVDVAAVTRREESPEIEVHDDATDEDEPYPHAANSAEEPTLTPLGRERSHVDEVRDSFMRAHSSQELSPNRSREEGVVIEPTAEPRIDVTIYVPEKPPPSIPKPLSSYVSAPSPKPVSSAASESLPKPLSSAQSMDAQLKEQLLAISAQIETAIRLAESEKTRKRRELGFLCLTQLYQSKHQPKENAPASELTLLRGEVLPPAVSVQKEVLTSQVPTEIEVGSPHSAHTASTAGTSVGKRFVRTGATGLAASPGTKSVSSQLSAPVGVAQLRGLLEDDSADTAVPTRGPPAETRHAAPPPVRTVDRAERHSPTKTDLSVRRDVKAELRPPSPPNVVVEKPQSRKGTEKRSAGLIFIDGSAPKRPESKERTQRPEVNEVKPERVPPPDESVLTEDHHLLEEQKRIQRKMQHKVNALEQRNRERSRSRGRGYGSRAGTTDEESSVQPTPVGRIIDPQTENAPSGYGERAVRKQRPQVEGHIDDNRSMFSAESAPSAASQKRSEARDNSKRSDLPDFPSSASKGAARRPVAVMDDAAMAQLEREVQMINELIGLRGGDGGHGAAPAAGAADDTAVEVRPKARPASVGRAGSAGRPRRDAERGGATTLTNVQQIRNAIQYVCLAGGADNTIREQVLAVINSENDEHLRRREQQQNEVGDSSSYDYDPFHLVLLLQDNSLGFKGVYRYRQSTGAITRICGKQGCPKIIDGSCVSAFYKYETSSRSFKQQHTTTHMNNTTDALSLDMVKMRRLQSR